MGRDVNAALNLNLVTWRQVGRYSVVGIATCYGSDGPGIESRWDEISWSPSRPALGPHPAYFTMGTGSLPGVNWLGDGVDHPPASSAEFEERVELYLYFPSGSS
jgi:hypothetical protein